MYISTANIETAALLFVRKHQDRLARHYSVEKYKNVRFKSDFHSTEFLVNIF